MKTMHKLLWPGAALVLALASGCASDPDRYYTLASPAPAAGVAQATPPLFIEVAPVAVPERLARPQMLVRQAARGAEVEVREKSRWSSSFEKELRDALSAGIAGRLGAIDASKAARQAGDQPSWRVALQVTRFDAVENVGVDAAVNWTLRRSDAARGVTCQWAGSEAAEAGIDGLAAGSQRVVARVAEAVARQISAGGACPVG